MLQSEKAEKLFAEDFEDDQAYRDKYREICTRIDKNTKESTHTNKTERRKIKLPKIAVKNLNVESKEFSSFRIQFKKIHEDSMIAEEDEKQYLVQFTEPKSWTKQLVSSLPANAEYFLKSDQAIKR